MELIDLMSGIGGAFVGYYAVRLFGLGVRNAVLAVKLWNRGRAANVAKRMADLALDKACSLQGGFDLMNVDFMKLQQRTQVLENTTHPTARVAILEEQVNDLIDLALAQTSSKYPLSKGVKEFLGKYEDIDGEKKDLPS